MFVYGQFEKLMLINACRGNMLLVHSASSFGRGSVMIYVILPYIYICVLLAIA